MDATTSIYDYDMLCGYFLIGLIGGGGGGFNFELSNLWFGVGRSRKGFDVEIIDRSSTDLLVLAT